jgi:hypothetical protein
MSHSKSKSTKIEEEKGKENKKMIINNSINYTNIDVSEQNLDLNLIINENGQLDKISNLLYDPDNIDKIVNISKLDETLYSEDRSKKSKIYEQSDSKAEMVIDEEINNSKPIINISQLEIPVDLKTESNCDNKNDTKNNINDINKSSVSSSNEINNNINQIKDKYAVFKNKNKKVLKTRTVICLIILVIIGIIIILYCLIAFSHGHR